MPYREEYVKSAVITFDDSPEACPAFYPSILDEDGFSAGYYVVNGSAIFSLVLRNLK